MTKCYITEGSLHPVYYSTYLLHISPLFRKMIKDNIMYTYVHTYYLLYHDVMIWYRMIMKGEITKHFILHITTKQWIKQ